MQKEELLHSLNWFYSLELSQVDLYYAQSKKMIIIMEVVFERVVQIEQGHVDFLSAQIKELGAIQHI